MMNFGFGLAGIISPFVFGYLIDKTGSWTLPFAGSIGLLLLGAGLAFRMHPDRPFEMEAGSSVAAVPGSSLSGT
jgi:cyanate permease